MSQEKKMVSVPFETLQKVFDAAIGSMDFTSGFLDDDEVSALREVGELLGVDPLVATPDNFKCKYAGKHEPWSDDYPNLRGTCMLCRRKIPENEKPKLRKGGHHGR
jgi:hypothetical protein